MIAFPLKIEETVPSSCFFTFDSWNFIQSSSWASNILSTFQAPISVSSSSSTNVSFWTTSFLLPILRAFSSSKTNLLMVTSSVLPVVIVRRNVFTPVLSKIPDGKSDISFRQYIDCKNSLNSFTVPPANVILAGNTIDKIPSLLKWRAKFSAAIMSYSLQINSELSSALYLTPNTGTDKIKSNFSDVNSYWYIFVCLISTMSLSSNISFKTL